MTVGKSVLVTGGARGIGAEISRAFASAGYKVYIHCGKSVEEAERLCAEIGGSFISADLASDNAPRTIADFCPNPDVLINNAGVSVVSPFDAVSEEDSARLYEVNLFAPLNLTRLLLPSMIRRKSGVIISVSSVFGRVGASCEVDYSVSKAALIGFTKALAKEVAPSGIRVNCICPGAIDTEMNNNLTRDEKDALIDEIPMLRLGLPKEIAEAALFLASEKASYITGAILDVGGGYCL